MATRDANDATWYVLQYRPDFQPRTDPGIPPWMSPSIDPSLFHDDDRHVLELRPGIPTQEAEPLAGLAVDVDGRIYRVDARTGRILVACGEHTRELVCERGALVAAAGLALDRRGLLYVADPPAHRVLVVNPDDGSLAGVLTGGLEEPVDVVASADGRLYVADRAGGRIVVFSSRFTRCGAFAPIDPDAAILPPRPIAVTIDADQAVLVADANAPRLLRFTRDGAFLDHREAHALARQDEAISLTALERAFGRRIPRFYAGTCGPCRPSRDGGDALVAVHRALRLLRLALSHEFAPCGSFISAALDGGSPGVQWHKIEIDADVPDGTWLKVQTATADDPEALNNTPPIPTVGEHDDLLALTTPAFVPFEDADCSVPPKMPDDVPDRLILSPPGRYLRLRVTLGSDGTATPSIRAIRVFYPRASYLDLLPRVYRRDPQSAFFLEHFLALFEHVFTGVENRYELFTRQLNPAATPPEILTWLACLIDLTFDPSWPLVRRRALVAATMDLYATRGTPRGLVRYVEIYTGVTPVIVEAFLERPTRPPYLGRTGMLLGATTQLAASGPNSDIEERVMARWAHRFTVYVGFEDRCDVEVMLPVIDRIVRVNKPAHTVHRLRVIRPEAQVGFARVGIDAMLGARESGSLELGGCEQIESGGRRKAVLGAEAILGEQRAAYARRPALTI